MNRIHFLEADLDKVDAAATSQNRQWFNFHLDTFAFANETKWLYSIDSATGRQVATSRVPKPDYTLRCFAMARAAKQFWLHARFEPVAHKPDDAACRRLIRKVVCRDAQKPSKPEVKVVIPGYADLCEFSAARESLLKAECRSAWGSYFQRGNWRMILPFTRGHQEAEAARLISRLQQGALPVLHVLSFPQLTINHTFLIFGESTRATTINFLAYDPNVPEQEVVLNFERTTRTFTLPPPALLKETLNKAKFSIFSLSG